MAGKMKKIAVPIDIKKTYLECYERLGFYCRGVWGKECVK